MAFGTQADLARQLGISPSAVSQAFKKHNVQLSTDGKFDLDYAAWLLKEKQCQNKSSAQRSATKQPAGIKDPKTRREILRLLLPNIFDKAVSELIKSQIDGQDFDDDPRNFASGMETFLTAYVILWDYIFEIINTEYPPEITDFPINKPEILQLKEIGAGGFFKQVLEKLEKDRLW